MLGGIPWFVKYINPAFLNPETTASATSFFSLGVPFKNGPKSIS
jgi:hypothetical protein